jgi:hypothetical protein
LYEFSLTFARKNSAENFEISCDDSGIFVDGMSRRAEVFVCSELQLSMDWKLHGRFGQGSDSATPVFDSGFSGCLDFLLSYRIQTTRHVWANCSGADFYVCDSVASRRFRSIDDGDWREFFFRSACGTKRPRLYGQQ